MRIECQVISPRLTEEFRQDRVPGPWRRSRLISPWGREGNPDGFGKALMSGTEGAANEGTVQKSVYTPRRTPVISVPASRFKPDSYP